MQPDDLAAYLATPRSKANIEAQARRVLADPRHLEAVWAVIERQPADRAWRAAWLLDMLSGMSFNPPAGHALRLIRHAGACGHEGMARCLLRAALAVKSLTEEEEGALADASLHWLDCPGTGIGMVGIAIEGMLRLCACYPDLWPELALRLEPLRATDSPALKSVLLRAQTVYQTKIAPRLHGR